MESKNIYLPVSARSHAVDEAQVLKNLSEVLNTLLPCMRKNEISEEFAAKLHSISIPSVENLESNIKAFEESIKCRQCKKLETLIYLENCEDGFCRTCIYTHLKNSTNRLMINNKYEGGNPKCPNCSCQLTRKDMKKILSDEYAIRNMECKVRKINKDLSQNCNFKCICCKKTRSPQMTPVDCMHMCRQCLADCLRKGISTCKCCGTHQRDGITSCKNMMQCKNCENTCYYMGDYMSEVCPGCVFCSDCLLALIDRKVCYCGQRILSKEDILEIYRTLYGACPDCDTEQLYQVLQSGCACKS